MRQIMLQIDMTLDGFIADEADEIGFVKDDAEMNSDASALLNTVDTILLGRRAYELFVDYWPGADMNAGTIESQLARQLNEAAKLVFSRTLDRVEWGKWDNARLVKDNIAEVMADLKRQPGKNMVLYAGAEIAATFMQLGLIDEYRIRLHPVTLGRGKSLFNDQTRLHLNPVSTKTYPNGAILLVYRPDSQ